MVPLSASGLGVHLLAVRDFTSVPRLIIIRSFDVNKPGEEVENLRGGESAPLPSD